MQPKAPVHGLDPLGLGGGQCGPFLGPPGFKRRAAGQPPRHDLPPENFRVVCSGGLRGGLVGAKLGQCHDEPRTAELGRHLCLCESGCRHGVVGFKLGESGRGFIERVGEGRGRIGFAMSEDNAPIRVVPLPPLQWDRPGGCSRYRLRKPCRPVATGCASSEAGRGC